MLLPIKGRFRCDMPSWRSVVGEIFPWHVWEDLTGFIESMKATGIHCVEDIGRELKSKYNIEVQIETIKEILIVGIRRD